MNRQTLSNVWFNHQMRSVNRRTVRRQDVDETATAPAASREKLNVTVASTAYQVFVLGVDNPDDASVTRYIP